MAAVSYLWIFSLFVFWAKKDDEFVLHHARQGVVLFVLSLAFWAIEILNLGLWVVFALMTMGFINAMMGNEFRIPIIREIADGTLTRFQVKKYWVEAKDKAQKTVQENKTSERLRRDLKEEEKVNLEQQKMINAEERMILKEEKKLSALKAQVEADEKRIARLEDEIEKMKKD